MQNSDVDSVGISTNKPSIALDKSPQAINWCFTLNNWSLDELVQLRGIAMTHNNVRYICWGQEVGTCNGKYTDGTPHLQGYLELKKGIRLTGVKKIVGARAHLEVRKGLQQQARDYCRKGEQLHSEWITDGPAGPNFGLNAKFEEHGQPNPNAKGSATEKSNLIQDRLLSIRDKIKAGVSEKTIYDEEPLMAAKYPRYIEKLVMWNKPPKRTDLKVEVHYGETYSGKTHQAFERFPDLYNMPVKSGNTLWFQGYSGEKVVLLDDFKGGFTLDQLLRLLDKYPISVEIKGGFTWFTPDLIIITTNFKEDEWYSYNNREAHRAALKRRITSRHIWANWKGTECDKDWKPLVEEILVYNTPDDRSVEEEPQTQNILSDMEDMAMEDIEDYLAGTDPDEIMITGWKDPPKVPPKNTFATYMQQQIHVVKIEDESEDSWEPHPENM
nr:putative replication associated protein [Crucivirus sp.]